MAKVRLSSGAEGDLQEIYLYTYDRYGEAQADGYHSAFERIFGLLADFPRMGSSADEIRPGLRGFPQGKHIVFYSIMDRDDILIERVLHGAMNIRRGLFDD